MTPKLVIRDGVAGAGRSPPLQKTFTGKTTDNFLIPGELAIKNYPDPHESPFIKPETEKRKARILLTGPPRGGKTTIIQKVAAAFAGQATGFYTREVREQRVRVGFEIVTLDGQAAMLSHVDFPGPYRVGKYGVDLESLLRLGLPALEVKPGIDLVVVDEVGKMECLSRQFIQAMERLWAQPVPLLITVAAKGGGYIHGIKAKPGATLITVTPANRDRLSDQISHILSSIR